MGNVQSNNPVANFFANGLNAWHYTLALGGDFEAVGNAPVAGHLPSHDKVRSDFNNIGFSIANMFTGGHHEELPQAPKLTQAQITAQNDVKLTQDLINPNNVLNSRNFGSVFSSTYSQAGAPNHGSNLGAPPSAIASIRSPHLKVMNSQVRGSIRNRHKTHLKQVDLGALSNPQGLMARNIAGGEGNPATSTEPNTGEPANALSNSTPAIPVV